MRWLVAACAGRATCHERQGIQQGPEPMGSAEVPQPARVAEWDLAIVVDGGVEVGVGSTYNLTFWWPAGDLWQTLTRANPCATFFCQLFPARFMHASAKRVINLLLVISLILLT